VVQRDKVHLRLFSGERNNSRFSQPPLSSLPQLAEIEDNTGLAIAEQLIEGKLQLLALDAI